MYVSDYINTTLESSGQDIPLTDAERRCRKAQQCVPCWEHRVTTPTQATLTGRASPQCVTAMHQQDSASPVHTHNHITMADKAVLPTLILFEKNQ